MSALSRAEFLALEERFGDPPDPPDDIDPQYADNWRAEYRRIPTMVLTVYDGGIPNAVSVWGEFWAALGPKGQVMWHENRSRINAT